MLLKLVIRGERFELPRRYVRQRLLQPGLLARKSFLTIADVESVTGFKTVAFKAV
jgi:hypothetical protein